MQIYKVKNLQRNWVSLCKGIVAAALFPHLADLSHPNIATKKINNKVRELLHGKHSMQEYHIKPNAGYRYYQTFILDGRRISIVW
jgi:hypothetical protein